MHASFLTDFYLYILAFEFVLDESSFSIYFFFSSYSVHFIILICLLINVRRIEKHEIVLKYVHFPMLYDWILVFSDDLFTLFCCYLFLWFGCAKNAVLATLVVIVVVVIA